MRNFGDILADFEENKTADIRKAFTTWLDSHEIEDKDAKLNENDQNVNINYKKLKIDATLDLHLLNKDEALKLLNSFFDDAIEKKYKKLLIIHGKGKHSQKEGLLGKVVRDFLEKHKNAGRRGYASREQGGSGATWVIIKGNE